MRVYSINLDSYLVYYLIIRLIYLVCYYFIRIDYELVRLIKCRLFSVKHK